MSWESVNTGLRILEPRNKITQLSEPAKWEQQD